MQKLEANLNTIKYKLNTCKTLSEAILYGKEILPPLQQALIYKLPQETTFNGSTTFIDTGIPQIDLKDGYSIVIRMNSKAWDNNRSLFGDYGLNTDHRGIVGLQFVTSTQSGYNNILTFRHYLDDKTKIIGIPTAEVPLNQYHILICTYDGANTGKVYIGDKLRMTNPYFAQLVPMNNLIIGRSTPSSAGRYFHGTMSHFLVYNKELSQEEINDIVLQIEGGTL